MVVLDVRIDNFYGFHNFKLNLSYPKKIVGSMLEEYLDGFPNFRYKKVVAIMGANAAGKTTFGKMLNNIFLFLMTNNYIWLTSAINNPEKVASFSIDIVGEKARLQRISCKINPNKERKYSTRDITLSASGEDIRSRDNYETCCARLDNKISVSATKNEWGKEDLGTLSWYIIPSENSNDGLELPSKSNVFPKVLEAVMKTLDPSIKKVSRFSASGIQNAYILYGNGESIILHKGTKISETYLSSGTKSGVKISAVLSSMLEHECSLYYCDELFPYVHAEVEKAMLSLMISAIGKNEQLFFTTHDTEILDLQMPMHAFVFFKKDVNDKSCPIKCISASDYLKRNTDVLKKAVENDLFSVMPQVEELFRLEEYIQ